MQVKVYEAQDMRSAIEKVKKELGPDAMILSSRNIYKTKLGVLGKPWIEVIAAVDTSMKPEKEDTKTEDNPFRNATGTEIVQETPEKTDPYQNMGLFEDILKKTQEVSRNQKYLNRDEYILDELKQMRQTFQGLSREISDIKGQWKKQMFSSHPNCNHQDFALINSEKKFAEQLGQLGIGPETMHVLIGMIRKKSANFDNTTYKKQRHILQQVVAEVINIENPLAVPWNGQKRISFIGPTGVGKTTTIAKVAANFLLNGGKNVALATIDNYRIAAAEQLKIYGQIMNVPVETAKSPQQLQNIFNRHQDKDLILLDTAGRSPKDELSLKELAAFLDPTLKIENHLVVSATTRERDLNSIIHRFQSLKLQGLVFTKLDECDLLGSILNVHLRVGYPVSFLTNGQKVPEDLLLPEPQQLAKMILQKNGIIEQWNFKKNATKQRLFVH
jgi:flagellar biosynthesis protein FlhF